MNYKSVVLFGKGQLVQEDKKRHALKVISDHVIKHSWYCLMKQIWRLQR
ncbi:MAG: nitroimidazol reductase NimA-like FMN-containing flavoprotein [Bacteroidia bacterium]|jgi:nitroimidazol reductase NimA-like FMN-containing flavoprotein (pyridoxamine 5'-phosphate oxidase superfamily)